MYPHGDNDLFQKLAPSWLRALSILSLVAFLPIAIIIFAPNILPIDLRNLMLALSFIVWGMATAALSFHGISMGYLPSRFYVSRGVNPIQFWVTIGILLLMAFGLVSVGGLSVVIFISKIVAS